MGKKYNNKNLQGMFLALLGFASYTCMDATTKYALFKYDISWQTITLYVSIFATFILLIYLISNKKATFKVSNPLWGFLKPFLSILSIFSVFFALPQIQLDLFYSIIFVSPIIAVIMAVFFLNEHLNIHKIVSLLGGFFGIIIITQPWEFFAKHNNVVLLAVLGTLYCALNDAANGTIMRKFLPKDNPLTLIFYQYLMGIIIGIIVLSFEHHSLVIENWNLAVLIMLIAIFGIVGSLLLLKGLQLGAVQLVSPMGYSQMVFGIVAGIILFNQYPHFNTLMGSTFIILSSIYLSLYANFARGNKDRKKWHTYLFVINKICAKLNKKPVKIKNKAK